MGKIGLSLISITNTNVKYIKSLKNGLINIRNYS